MCISVAYVLYKHVYACIRPRQVNMRPDPVKLLARHWQFFNDADQLVTVVHKWAPGVVGAQPVLPPKCGIQYSSWTQMASKEGTMEGAFLLQPLQDRSQYHQGPYQQHGQQEDAQVAQIEAEVGPVHLDSSVAV